MRSRWTALLSLLAIAGCAAAPAAYAPAGPGLGQAATAAHAALRRPYQNPIVNRDFPDPGALHASDGAFYAYATQTNLAGKMINIQVMRSSDMSHWQDLGDALPSKPAWASGTQNFWAPHVVEAGGRYLMYYAAQADNGQGMAIGVASANGPAGPFVPAPDFLLQSPGFEAIDPMAFDDPQTGKVYLYWGSGFQAIKVRELASDRMHFAADAPTIEVLKPADRPHEHLVEGVWTIYRQGYYYLFYSGDNCCGPHPSYAVMVARSTSPTGPFEKRADATGQPSSVVLDANERYLGPGHIATITDATGQDWMLYHAIDARQPTNADGSTRRPLMLDPITFVNGWPRVGSGSPSFVSRPGPALAKGLPALGR